MFTIIGIENSQNVDVTGTYLQGYVEGYYYDIVSVFGDPTIYVGDKSNAEWWLSFRVQEENNKFENVVACIYDWKQPDIPGSKYRWHIGGDSWKSVECVHQFFYKNCSNNG